MSHSQNRVACCSQVTTTSTAMCGIRCDRRELVSVPNELFFTESKSNVKQIRISWLLRHLSWFCFRSVGRSRQSCILPGSHRGRYGCVHRIMGFVPQDMELGKTSFARLHILITRLLNVFMFNYSLIFE